MRKKELIENGEDYRFVNKITGKDAKIRWPRKLKKLAKKHWFPGRESKQGRLEYSAYGGCHGGTFTISPVI